MSRNTRASAQDPKYDLSAAAFEEKCKDGPILDWSHLTERSRQTNGAGVPASILGTKRSGAPMETTTESKERKTSTEEPTCRSWEQVEQEVAERNMANPKLQLEVVPGAAQSFPSRRWANTSAPTWTR
ncbi:hypothetical protein TI39_contig4111g00010 [Zymoseptoria brevis]|uniref:Uncharacterized protein n=1 Tax=Zymoseptoria brevis TaxID=1047168 RepID=A0A0F4GDJ0_9PEZI|nr:hypothetical protein TI39_contig4111g00010 [Zymoseptoria brevis]